MSVFFHLYVGATQTMNWSRYHLSSNCLIFNYCLSVLFVYKFSQVFITCSMSSKGALFSIWIIVTNFIFVCFRTPFGAQPTPWIHSCHVSNSQQQNNSSQKHSRRPETKAKLLHLHQQVGEPLVRRRRRCWKWTAASWDLQSMPIPSAPTWERLTEYDFFDGPVCGTVEVLKLFIGHCVTCYSMVGLHVCMPFGLFYILLIDYVTFVILSDRCCRAWFYSSNGAQPSSLMHIPCTASVWFSSLNLYIRLVKW